MDYKKKYLKYKLKYLTAKKILSHQLKLKGGNLACTKTDETDETDSGWYEKCSWAVGAALRTGASCIPGGPGAVKIWDIYNDLWANKDESDRLFGLAVNLALQIEDVEAPPESLLDKINERDLTKINIHITRLLQLIYSPPMVDSLSKNEYGTYSKVVNNERGIEERMRLWGENGCGAEKISNFNNLPECISLKTGADALTALKDKAENSSILGKVLKQVLEKKEFTEGMTGTGEDLNKIIKWLGQRLRKIKKLISIKIKILIEKMKTDLKTGIKLCPGKDLGDNAITALLTEYNTSIEDLQDGMDLFDSLKKIATEQPPSSPGFVMGDSELQEFLFGFMSEILDL